MKTLILMRHAKSSWNNPNLPDFERPLNKRGKFDALLMAEVLRELKLNFDYLLTSSAKRAMDTAKIISDKLNLQMTIDKNLYLASSTLILEIINRIDEEFSNILIIAHNPGLTSLANQISNYQLENLPTSGIIAFTFDGIWKDFGKKKCDFLFYEFPKKYK